ncbi:hypothetical protein KW790_00530 [Candidatus Parcubacteria bacterium]|nr:hypothetical protein [Candidatus Parcubacteria bacterium]
MADLVTWIYTPDQAAEVYMMEKYNGAHPHEIDYDPVQEFWTPVGILLYFLVYDLERVYTLVLGFKHGEVKKLSHGRMAVNFEPIEGRNDRKEILEELKLAHAVLPIEFYE